MLLAAVAQVWLVETHPGVGSSTGKMGANNPPALTARRLVEGQPDTVLLRGEQARLASLPAGCVGSWLHFRRLVLSGCARRVYPGHRGTVISGGRCCSRVVQELSASATLEVITGKR